MNNLKHGWYCAHIIGTDHGCSRVWRSKGIWLNGKLPVDHWLKKDNIDNIGDIVNGLITKYFEAWVCVYRSFPRVRIENNSANFGMAD